MNVLPVINRELRAEARSPFTYWLRVLGAGTVILAAALFILLHGIRVADGGRLFTQLHGALQLAIWGIVPMLTADCISRERREGTLGILFLTPLKALDIVVAKSLAHGLRAVTLLLAVLPVVALPLLMGGVTWKQALASLFLNASALCLALAAGLLASACSKTWVRSLILASCFAGMLAILFWVELGCLFSTSSMRYRVNLYGIEDDWWKTGFQLAIGLNPEFFSTFYYSRSRLGFAPGAPVNAIGQSIFITAAVSLVLSVIALLFGAFVAAMITKRSWQERPPGPASAWLSKQLCTPIVMLDMLQRWMKRKLDRNPIGWLEQRTWSGRLVIWSWFAVMISVYSLVLTNANYLTRSFHEVHVVMGWILVLSMAVNASTSFRRERENRVLELLLVSPLNEGQIILGRLRGLWGQFLPSMLLLLAGWMYLAIALDRFDREFSSIIFIAAAFAAIPVIGLCFSLVCRNFLTALIWTIAVGLIAPAIHLTVLRAIFMFAGVTIGPDFRSIEFLFHPLPYQLIAAWVLYLQLHRCLKQRRFATETT